MNKGGRRVALRLRIRNLRRGILDLPQGCRGARAVAALSAGPVVIKASCKLLGGLLGPGGVPEAVLGWALLHHPTLGV